MIAGSLHLAWRYVARHRLQTLLLSGALGLVLALPLCVHIVVREAQNAMRSRAAVTPQIIGARGSALDLLLTALYFKLQPLPTIPAATVTEIRATGLGAAIPLHIRFHAQGAPIIGTELEYFPFRTLQLAQGKMISRLGDCVIGARLAANRGLQPGSQLFSSQEQVFDLAGIYPLKMRITGILAPNGTPDDDAIFVDLKTTWLIQGLAHGHEELAGKADLTLKQEDGNTIGNAAVRIYNEVTDTNLDSFHFHGDTGQYPISAVIALPRDAKSEALLAGRYLKTDNPLQLIRPLDEFDNLIRTLFQIQNLVLGLLGLIALAALSVAALVFALSFRLRQRQFQTLADLGVARSSLLVTKTLEVALVGALGIVIALLLALLVRLNATSWIGVLLR
ncbi:MAG TPA: ABC transporter permease [Prosthecobacter sp.]|nr:ABC transporter permease [Prosthecobacter sp.]